MSLHGAKTRLIEFGRLPALEHARRGLRRPATFAFLGFTHYRAWSRDGRFVVKRKTQSLRLSAKLTALREEARRRMHAPVISQHHWLTQVLRGRYAYFGLASNFRSLNAFFREVQRLWFRTLRRRSQRRLPWPRYVQLLESLPLPSPRLSPPRDVAPL